jgi:hypothetical protein
MIVGNGRVAFEKKDVTGFVWAKDHKEIEEIEVIESLVGIRAVPNVLVESGTRGGVKADGVLEVMLFMLADLAADGLKE